MTPTRRQAIVGTIMGLVGLVHAWLNVNFHAMASAVPDPATGRTFYWSFSRSNRLSYVTHDQYWALAVTAGIAVACFFVLIFTDRSYRELGEG